VSSVGRRFLVDLIDGQEPGSPLIGRSDRLHQFVARSPEGTTAIGHLREMDIGVEVVEDDEVLVGGVWWRIDPQ
jgi:hypothetical protein